MAETKPPAIVDLTWDGELVFTARDSRHSWVLDGRNQAGPSPVMALASALAGCMGIDMVVILTRGRHAVRALQTHLVGHRADDDPRRFVRIEMRFTIDTDAAPDQIQRAVDLSREKYQDIELVTSVVRPAATDQPEGASSGS
jgi:putative redox protein